MEAHRGARHCVGHREDVDRGRRHCQHETLMVEAHCDLLLVCLSNDSNAE